MNKISTSDMTTKITTWISEVMRKQGFTKIVIGVSGGVDSATALSLCVRALGKENVYPLLLPYGNLNTRGLQLGNEVVKELEIPSHNVEIYDIQPVVDIYTHTTTNNSEDIVRKGNIMARARMIYLYDYAKRYNGLVCGTENKSEYYLGYFTRFGDEAADLEPIRHLYKTHVWELARYLNISASIITSAPTAGLWENQSDEKELGFSYQESDKILYYLFDKKLSHREIEKLGVAKELLHKVLTCIEKNKFKHSLPYIVL